MKQLVQIILSGIIIFACSTGTKEEIYRPATWIGEWTATWETPAASYPGLVDMEFYMEGKFIFTADSLTVVNNGYPGCIFAVDTLEHTQSWRITNDTLISYNEPSTPGMTYRIISQTTGQVKLQLIDDIFVTLSR